MSIIHKHKCRNLSKSGVGGEWTRVKSRSESKRGDRIGSVSRTRKRIWAMSWERENVRGYIQR